MTDPVTPTPRKRVALVDYPPSQTYVLTSLLPALKKALPDWKLVTSIDAMEESEVPDLQWSDYDELDWDVAMEGSGRRMANSYVIRKSLIRKNHLAHTQALYLAKNPSSTLRPAVLKSFTFQLSFPDELDELLQDDLYELDEAFEADAGKSAEQRRWWILKAALADKGNGIRLLSSKEMLQDIFEEFEDEYESEDEEQGTDGARDASGYGDATRVSSSQMREWVIQEYVASPLLLDPHSKRNSTPHKFHLRVYVVAVGGLTVYVHHPFLALFAPTPYQAPSTSDGGRVDLSSHLTNTCLQECLEDGSKPEIAVRTLQDMAESAILGGKWRGEELGTARIKKIEVRVGEIVAEMFTAGVNAGSGFQVLPNCFEIFGCDFLVDSTFNVSLLEINACPDFTQTGLELQSVIDTLFAETIRVAILPFFDEAVASEVKESLEDGLKKVLEMQVSRACRRGRPWAYQINISGVSALRASANMRDGSAFRLPLGPPFSPFPLASHLQSSPHSRAMEIDPTSVSFPSRTAHDGFPTSAGENLFEFVFSNPVSKESPYTQKLPKKSRHHVLPGPIPLSKPIFRDGQTGATLSWGRLRDDALRVASSLIHGPLALRPAPLSTSDPAVNRGAVISPLVLLHLPNCLHFPIIAFGVMASGLTLTGANPGLTPGELAHILSTAQPQVLVTTAQGLPNLQEAYKLLNPEVQSRLAYPTRGNVFIVELSADDYGASAASLARQPVYDVAGWKLQDWKTLLPVTPYAPFVPPKYFGDEDALRAAMIFWSSGTSGKSKGVILSHKACASAILSCWHGSGLEADERLVGLPPFYHIFGWANVLMAGPAFGATVTIMSKFEPRAYLRLVEETKATHLHIAPPVAVLFAKSPLLNGFDLSSVKYCTSGGAPLGSNIITDVYNRLGFMVRMGYGLSETSGVTGVASKSWSELLPILGSTGIAFPGAEIRIISVSDGKTVSVGEEGEVLLRAATNMTAYLNNAKATEEALDSEAWFHTGDVGKLDGQGNLWIVDRLKDVLKVKGFQVSPADLEDGLCGHPAVQDAGVTSVYNEDHGTEYPIAYVVPFDKSVLKGGAAARDFVRDVNKHFEGKFAPYKWIRGGYMIIETVPKSPSGKILRRMLKDTKGHHVAAYEEKVRAKL